MFKRNARREVTPNFDQAYSALLEDLRDRGMLASTIVTAMGEFGRTPKINPAGGRDHHPGVWTILMGGGPIKGGRVVGSSDAFGMYPKERPVHVSELAATIFQALGIDPRTQFKDIQGQLRFVCDGNAVEEVF